MKAFYRSGFMLLAATCSEYYCTSPWNILVTTMDLAKTKTTFLSLYRTLFYFAKGKVVVCWTGSNFKTMPTEQNYMLHLYSRDDR